MTSFHVQHARGIAEDVLWPAADEVDRSGTIPASHLDRLAAAGLYGMAGPVEAGGLGIEDFGEVCSIVEALASGCLSTAFVWLQHHGAVRHAAASGAAGVPERWLGPLCRGERRAGVAQAALRPGPASVRAERVAGGFVFDGESPWVTGWGLIDTLDTAARTAQGTVVWALLPAVGTATLKITPLDMVAVNATKTVHLCLAEHFVPDELVTVEEPFTGQTPVPGLRINASLALGLVDRCARIVGGSDGKALEVELAQCRSRLDAADDETIAAARAASAELAVRAASAVVVAEGARAVLPAGTGQRLLREAGFLLVFGSRPQIKAATMDRLVGRGAAC